MTVRQDTPEATAELIARAAAVAASDDPATAAQAQAVLADLAVLADNLRTDRDQLRTEARTAHDQLTALAVDLVWATDGTLRAATTQVNELVRRLRETIAAQDKQLTAIREHIALMNPTGRTATELTAILNQTQEVTR